SGKLGSEPDELTVVGRVVPALDAEPGRHRWEPGLKRPIAVAGEHLGAQRFGLEPGVRGGSLVQSLVERQRRNRARDHQQKTPGRELHGSSYLTIDNISLVR